MTIRGLYSFFTALLFIITARLQGQNTASGVSVVSDSVQVNAPADTSIAESDFSLENVIIYNSKDSSYFDIENQTLHLYGKAEVVYGDLKVNADYIRFSFSESIATARGLRDSTGKVIEKAVFTEGDTSFDEDSLAYNFKSKKGISYGVRTREGDAYLLSTISKKATNNWVSIGGGKFTTCDREMPHYYFQLHRAMVIPNEKVVSGPVLLKIWKIPTVGLPFGFFPNKKESTHGILLPGYGNGDRKGYFIQNLGYYIPINDHIETRVLADIYTRGSWSIRNITAYKKNYKYNGSFNISRTVNKEGFPELPSYFKTTNFNLQWTHNQDPKSKPNTGFNSSVNLGTLNNFRNNLNTSQQDFLSSTFSSRIQYTKAWPDTPFNLGLTAGHTQNTQSKIVQITLPTVALNMNRITLGRFVENPGRFKNFMNQIGLNGALNAENSISEKATVFRFDNLDSLWQKSRNGVRMSSGLSTTVNAKKFGTVSLNLNGSAVGTFKYLENSFNDQTQTFSRDTLYGFRGAVNWNTSATLNSRIYGTFNFRNGRKIKAIRHFIQTAIGTSYSPFSNYREGLFDNTGRFVGYSPYDIAQYQPVNSNQAFSANFAVTQNFEAKVRDKTSAKLQYNKVKIIESWRISTSKNFLADSVKWSNVSMTAFTTIAKKITVNYSSTYSLYDRDSTGRTIDRFLINSQNKLMRMDGTNLALGFRLQSKNKQAPARADQSLTPEEQKVISQNQNQLIDFSIPWNLNLNYNVRLARTRDVSTGQDKINTTQAITFVGDITILKRWAISVNSGYDMKDIKWSDFDRKQLGLRNFTTTNIGFHWDLHCWEFSVNYVPFGQRKSYMAQLNIKSPLLQDLKVQRRGNLGDNTLLY